jgi:hypothetical protein
VLPKLIPAEDEAIVSVAVSLPSAIASSATINRHYRE